jgi:hypothetical protein
MSPKSGLLWELKAYLIYVGGLLSVFALMMPMALVGIPTGGGAPGYIHATNLMIWSIPGIASMRWVLGFTYGVRPSWGRVFAGYAHSGVLVAVLVGVAEQSTVSPIDLQWTGIAICLSLGYAFNRLLVLADPRYEALAGEGAS